MQIGHTVGWLCLIYLTIPLTGWAKGATTRIEIHGEGLSKAIEIMDPNIVNRASIWNGPQVTGCDANGNCVAQTDPEKTAAIVDWPKGIAIKPPGNLTRYLVAPDFSDKEMRNEIISNGIEGNWFHAAARWEALVRPIIEKTAHIPVRERSDVEHGKMNFMALEISVNGERLYTVGADKWRTLWAHVLGHRLTPDSFTPEMMPPGEEVPESDAMRINFSASVSVPEDEHEILKSAPTQTGNQYLTKSYKSRRLNVIGGRR